MCVCILVYISINNCCNNEQTFFSPGNVYPRHTNQLHGHFGTRTKHARATIVYFAVALLSSMRIQLIGPLTARAHTTRPHHSRAPVFVIK